MEYLTFELSLVALVGWALFALWFPQKWRRVLAAGVLAQGLALLALGILSLDQVEASGPLPLWLPFLTYDLLFWLAVVGTLAGVATGVGDSRIWYAVAATKNAPAPSSLWHASTAHPKRKAWLCDARGWRYFLHTVASATILGYGGWLDYAQFLPTMPREGLALRVLLVFAWMSIWLLATGLPWRGLRSISHAIAAGLAGWFSIWWGFQLTVWNPHRGAVSARWWLITYLTLLIVSLLATLGIVILLRRQCAHNQGDKSAAPSPSDDDDMNVMSDWDQAVRDD